MNRFLGLAALLALTITITGCGHDPRDAAKKTGPTCTPPEGTLSTVDGSGRILWDPSLDGTASLIVCDGNVARPLLVRGIVQGEVIDNQAAFATDGAGKVITAERVVTTSTTFTWIDGMLLEAQCLDMAWKGACDPA